MVNCFRLIFYLFLFFFFHSAFAALTPISYYALDGYSGTYSTPRDACASYSPPTDGSYHWSVYQYAENSPCLYQKVYPGGYLGSVLKPGPIVRYYSNSCPSNSSLSGSQCICNEGYEEKNGACVLPESPDACDGLADYCETKRGSSSFWSMSGVSRNPSMVCIKPKVFVPVIGGSNSYWDDKFPGCAKGCLMLPDGFSASYADDSGNWITSGEGTYQGSDCSPNAIAETEDDDELPEEAEEPSNNCKFGTPGIVNGLQVCLPPSESKEKLAEKETSNSDGTKTTEERTVNCKNGLCTLVTDKVTTDGNGNVISSGSDTITIDQDAFCARNPTARVCGGSGSGSDGDGSFSGSCESGRPMRSDAFRCRDLGKRLLHLGDDRR